MMNGKPDGLLTLTHSQVTPFSPKRGKAELGENLQRLLNDKKLPNVNIWLEYHLQLLLL